MATIKSYSDIEQSKRLAEILPIDSADMYYSLDNIFMEYENTPTVTEEDDHFELFQSDIPCWSFAALFDVLPNGTDISKADTDTENEKYMCTVGINNDIISTFANNPVDACVEMILKLYERKML